MSANIGRQGTAIVEMAGLATVHRLLNDNEPRAALAMLASIGGRHDEAEVLALEGAAHLLLGHYAEAEAMTRRGRERQLVSLDMDLVHAQALEQLGSIDDAINVLESAITRTDQPSRAESVVLQARIVQSRLCLIAGDSHRALRTLDGADTEARSSLEYQQAYLTAAAATGNENATRLSALFLVRDPRVTSSIIIDLCAKLFGRSFFWLIVELEEARCTSGLPVMELAGYAAAARIMLARPDEKIGKSQLLVAIAEIDTWVGRRSVRGAALFRLAWFGRRILPAAMVGNLIVRAMQASIDTDFHLWPVILHLRLDIEELLGLLPNGAFEYFWHNDHNIAVDTLALWGRLCCERGETLGVFALAAAIIRAPHRTGVRFAFAQALAGVGQLEPAREIFASTGCIADPEVHATMWPPFWPQRPLDAAPYEEMLPTGASWPKISIVIPTYNQGQFIEETLLSILGQNYPALELIVMDGGSTDQTMDVLKRYHQHFDHMVSEPDKGQSDAINKGFKLVTGDLVTWLNSDDMLAPGAMHMWALEWIRSDADLLFGICVAHSKKVVKLINQPRVRQNEFTVGTLGNIGDYWLQGHYFYQPEVIFSRRILDKVGGRVNADNFYCMDYELFLNFARQGAKISSVPWPTALFRQHEQQKTSRLDECVQEQGKVRDQYIADLLLPERKADIAARLRRFAALGSPRVLVVTTRLNKIIAARTSAEVRTVFAKMSIDCDLTDNVNPSAWLEYDVVILMVHLWPTERTVLEAVRHHARRPLLVGWFWDNHHLYMDNVATSRLLDIVIPGHDFAGAYLRSTNSALWPSLPLCVTQWTAEEASRFASSLTPAAERHRDLYGGFVEYPDAKDRNARLRKLLDSGLFPMIYAIDPIRLDRYFSQTAAQRFAEWGTYATSLCLPFDRDLSQRFFDAWLTGQIPVVTPDIVDLNVVPELAALRGIDFVVADDVEPAAVEAASRRALELFDAGGDEGVLRRHTLAVEHHMLADRLKTIVSRLLQVEPGNFMPIPKK